MTNPDSTLVTGGAGFIGSAVVRELLTRHTGPVVVLDTLSYAGARDNLPNSVHLTLVVGDITDAARVTNLLRDTQPARILHLAAESHVDRSIDNPLAFIHTNVLGTGVLLEATRAYHATLSAEARAAFRFVHVSTDEVFGSLGDHGRFHTRTPYDPRSPYSASKASSDHIARAYFHTYGLPVVVTNCSNNYGPRQHPEKLIPHMILRAIAGEPLPIYGTGGNVRDWLHVHDHARGLVDAALHGTPGANYLFGGDSERTNLQVVHALCALLDTREPTHAPHAQLLRFVTDRPGHDQRYAIDATSAAQGLSWKPSHSFDSGLAETIDWYLNHPDWCAARVNANGLMRRGVSETHT